VRESWQEHFAESPDVLLGARRQRTIVRVRDFAIGGDEFVTMAGPCSVETERQLMATAHHVRSAGARVLRGGAFKPRSSPYSFQGLGLEGLKLLAAAREETGLAIVTEVMTETTSHSSPITQTFCRSGLAAWRTTRCWKLRRDPDGRFF
jgi:3-deoxy-D-arabino-heptulosonate 7-phosphate (DAHP) synthase